MGPATPSPSPLNTPLRSYGECAALYFVNVEKIAPDSLPACPYLRPIVGWAESEIACLDPSGEVGPERDTLALRLPRTLVKLSMSVQCRYRTSAGGRGRSLAGVRRVGSAWRRGELRGATPAAGPGWSGANGLGAADGAAPIRATQLAHRWCRTAMSAGRVAPCDRAAEGGQGSGCCRLPPRWWVLGSGRARRHCSSDYPSTSCLTSLWDLTIGAGQRRPPWRAAGRCPGPAVGPRGAATLPKQPADASCPPGQACLCRGAPADAGAVGRGRSIEYGTADLGKSAAPAVPDHRWRRTQSSTADIALSGLPGSRPGGSTTRFAESGRQRGRLGRRGGVCRPCAPDPRVRTPDRTHANRAARR